MLTSLKIRWVSSQTRPDVQIIVLISNLMTAKKVIKAFDHMLIEKPYHCLQIIQRHQMAIIRQKCPN